MTAPSRTRDATATIAGYVYQFDKTILEILGSSAAETVVVEGIEDVDLLSAQAVTAIQVKYHEGQKFGLPILRKPLLMMLREFDPDRRLKLYVHFGQDGPEVPQRLTVDEIRTALTEHKRKPKPRIERHYAPFEAILDAFGGRLEIESGPSFDDQREEVYKALMDALSAAREDVVELHYSDALVAVLDLARNPDHAKREIKRAAFVAELDKRSGLFTRWHREMLGRERYIAAVKRQVKSLGLLKSTTWRAIVIGARELGTANDSTRVADVLASLAHSSMAGKLRTARPWTVVLEAKPEHVRGIKTALVERDVLFRDGYEDLSFRPSLFDRRLRVTTAARGQKVVDSSYDLRVVGLDTYSARAGELEPPNALLTFRDDPVTLEFGGYGPRRLDIAGTDIEQIADIIGAFK